MDEYEWKKTLYTSVLLLMAVGGFVGVIIYLG